ncbi:MAG: hypothetical protein H5T69_04260 [Chloroflexi bacterium]|nr:hypothetical protein [Chloroflexota bacterium]
MAKRKAQNSWVLGVVLASALILVAILLAVEPSFSALHGLLRAAGVMGYLAVFLSILSSAYLRELVKFFGRSFVQTHHILSLTALGLLVVHPLSAVFFSGTARVLVPNLSSLRNFVTRGGAPALYLLILAALAAWRRWPKTGWRVVHYLTYLAFLLGTAHAILLGTDGRFLVVRIVAILMAIAAVLVFVRRHYPAAQRKGQR